MEKFKKETTGVSPDDLAAMGLDGAVEELKDREETDETKSPEQMH